MCFKFQPLYENVANEHESERGQTIQVRGTAQEFCQHDPAQKRHAESRGVSSSNRFIRMAPLNNVHESVLGQIRGTAQEFCPHDPAQKRHDEFECFKIQPLWRHCT